MANFFFETSALVKRYVSEPGSAWVNGLIAAATTDDICLASLTSVEVIAAITRRQRGGTIPAADAALLIRQFRQELANDFVVSQISPADIGAAMDLAERHGLRGADALQLAVALDRFQQCQAMSLRMVLISADHELNTAALAEGLTVDDPNHHP